MTTMMRNHPHLPLLDFDKCMAVFKLAGIGFNRLAQLSGFSRQAVYFWRTNQRAPSSDAIERVSTLAYAALALLREKRLPIPGRPKLAVLETALDSVSLEQVTTEVLPAKWREELNNERAA